jgi:hypothetical protein
MPLNAATQKAANSRGPASGSQEGTQLIGAPGLLFDLGDRTQPGCVGQGDV